MAVKKRKSVEGLVIETMSPRSLRGDVFRLCRHLADAPVQLTRQERRIPMPRLRRLSALMSVEEELDRVSYDTSWAVLVARVARELGLIHFDERKAARRMKLRPRKWQAYLSRSDMEREQALLEALMQILPNEFYEPSPVVRSTRFDGAGRERFASAGLDRPAVRRAILAELSGLDAGRWYDFPSLVAHFKSRLPNLILDHTRRPSRPAADQDFYARFRETTTEGRREIHSSMKDAYERVEGRYLAFFLETLPLILDLVELAFRPDRPGDGSCSPRGVGRLQAFRLTRRGKAILAGDTSYEFRRALIILQDFDVHLEMPDFSEEPLLALEPYVALERVGHVYRGKLTRKQISKASLAGRDLDQFLDFLRQEAKEPIPQNVRHELREWATGTEKVVLYDGVGLLTAPGAAGDLAEMPSIASRLVAAPSADCLILWDPEGAYEELVSEGRVPHRAEAGGADKIRLARCRTLTGT